MVAPVLAAGGAGLFGAGTLSKVLGKDRDFPFEFGVLKFQNGRFEPVRVDALDTGSKERAGQILQDTADQLNEVIQRTGKQPRQKFVQVGLGAPGRPGAVSQGGLFFGDQPEKGVRRTEFLQGVRPDTQGFTDTGQFFNSLNQFVFGEGAPQFQGTSQRIDAPQAFEANNIFQKLGTLGQFGGGALALGGLLAPGAAAGGAGSAAGTGAASGAAGTGAATGGGFTASSLAGAPGFGSAAANTALANAITPTFASGITAGAVPSALSIPGVGTSIAEAAGNFLPGAADFAGLSGAAGGPGLFNPARTAATTGGRKALEQIDKSTIPDQRSLPPGISPERAAQIAEIAGGSGMANGLFGLSPNALSGIATAGSTLLGGLMGGGDGQQVATQRTQLPPEFSRALNFLLDEGIGLAQTDFPLTPELSDPTLAGINQLNQPFGGPGVDVLNQTASGQFLNANPFTNVNPFAFAGNDLSGVTDAITQAATRAVGDRFSQAGRSSSPAEGLSLASTVSRELAPFAFGARESQLERQFGAGESALRRGFGGFEAERARQLDSAQPLINLQQQGIENLLSAGDILEQQQGQRALDPFLRLQLASSPITAAIGGAPTTTTTTQPVNRNRAAGALGGSLLGSQIGGEFGSFGGPIGAGLGGLLGGFL